MVVYMQRLSIYNIWYIIKFWMVDSGYAIEATNCLQALIIRIEYNNNAFDNHHLNLFFILFIYYFLQAIRLEMIFQTFFFPRENISSCPNLHRFYFMNSLFRFSTFFEAVRL